MMTYTSPLCKDPCVNKNEKFQMCQVDKPGNGGVQVLNFLFKITSESLRHGHMNDVIYEAEGAQDCGYGCM